MIPPTGTPTDTPADSRTGSRRWWLVFGCGAGLLLLGALALWRALDASRSVAREAARQATTARAGALQAQLQDAPRLLRTFPGRAIRFRIVGGALELPEDLPVLEPRELDPRAELPPQVVALATPRATAADLERLAGLLPALSDAGAAWLHAYLSWRGAAPAEAPVIETENAAALGAVVASRILHAVSSGRDPDPSDWAHAKSLADERVAGLCLRLRDRDRTELATELEAAAALVAARRAALRAVPVDAVASRTTGGARVTDSAVPHLVCWEPATADGSIQGVALADPVAAARAVSTESGAVFTGEPGPDRVAVFDPGLYLQLPPADGSGDYALLALGVVLSLCGLGFALGLRATARAVARETAATRTRADFLQTVTHELKTPLASIRLLAERLAEGRVTKAAKRSEHHRLLAAEAARLSVLVENVLDLGRMERGERGYDRRAERPDEVVREAVALFAPIAEAAGLQVQCTLDGPEGEVELDRSALTQAVVNVLENARKYAAAGGRLELSSRAFGGEGWQLAIRDFGPGVDAAERESIFDRFVRGRDQRHGSVAGVGLGLHLARRILRAHGGELRCAAPADGPGAVFVFELPARREPWSGEKA